MDTMTVAAAALWKTYRLGEYSHELVAPFGKDVILLLDALAAVHRLSGREWMDVDAGMTAIIQDPRVFMVLFAQRLRHVRTGRRMTPVVEQIQLAREAREVLAPLAHHLGMSSIQATLEDRAFAVLQPKEYSAISGALQKNKIARNIHVKQAVRNIDRSLKKSGLLASVDAVNLNCYSIYKMAIKAPSGKLNYVTDVAKFRVLVSDPADCYKALGVLHLGWTPIIERFADHIARPQFDMYRALHTTVADESGERFDIQIETDTMRKASTYGVTTAWRFGKSLGEGAAYPRLRDTDLQGVVKWSELLSEWRNSATTEEEFRRWFSVLAGRTLESGVEGDDPPSMLVGGEKIFAEIDVELAAGTPLQSIITAIATAGGEVIRFVPLRGGKNGMRISVEFGDRQHFDRLIRILLAVRGVESVHRIA